MMKHWHKLLAAGISVFLLLLLLDAYPGLRGGAGWQWAYDLAFDWATPQTWQPALILAAVLIVYLAGAWAVRNRRLRWVQLWALIGTVAITYAVVGVRGDAGFLLFTRTVSPVQTGASSLAVHVMAADGVEATLRNWTQVMDDAYGLNLIHFTTSPPGQALVHYHLAQAFDAPQLAALTHPLSRMLRAYQCSDLQVMLYTQGEIVSAGVIAFLMPLLAGLAVYPLTTAARALTFYADDRVPRVVLWWALIPTIALFAPTWNTLYPALCVGSFVLLLRGLQRRYFSLVVLSGVVMAATTLLNFAMLPLLFFFGLVTLGYAFVILQGRTRVQALGWAVMNGVSFGVGLFSLWAVFWLITGVYPLDILSITLSSHRDIVQREAGDYFAWLLLHPYDVALFVGLPVMGLALVGMLSAWRSLRSGRRLLWDVVALSLGATLIVVNVLGIVQGENGRILSFYAPFLLLVGVGKLTETPQQHTGRDALLMGVQALSVWVMAVALTVVPLDLNPQVTQPRADIGAMGDGLPFITPNATFTSDQYAGAFSLAGYRYIADPAAQAISYEWQWQGDTPTDRPYLFEVVARANNELDGDIEATPFQWYAQSGDYLPTCWQAGDTVRDVIVVPLPPVSMPVVWEVELRAIDHRTGDVLRINGEHAPLTLAPVQYP